MSPQPTQNHNIIHSQGLDLIEDWPTKQKKQVSFAKYASLHIYNCSLTYRSTMMSYSAADQKAFQAQALQDGLRIGQLIAASTLDTGAAIHRLFERNIISCEDLIGIEHLISDRAIMAVRDKRKTHVQLVLGLKEEVQKKNGERVKLIVKALKVSSSKSAKKAQLRAILAV